MTAKRDDVPFLTIQEGVQFRNCITKFSTWLPTLSQNLEDSSFAYNLDKFVAMDSQTSNDPWA